MDSQRISDELEIAALLTRYARAVDSKDWDLYCSVFTDDAHIDYSAEVMQGPLDDVVEFFRHVWSPMVTMSMRYITNIECEIDGDAAHVRAMFYHPPQIKGLAVLSTFGGYYHHEGFAHRSAGAAVTFARKWCGQPTRRETLRPERPIAHRRQRFRGRGCHAPCMTPHAREPDERIPLRRPWDWHPTRCQVSG